MRRLLPLPVTVMASPAPGAGTSLRLRLSASEMRRPEPYRRPSTAASRAKIHGGRSSPARASLSVTFRADTTESGLGSVLAILGERTANSAPILPPWLRSRKRANERAPASPRASERPVMPSARRAAMKARMSGGPRRGEPLEAHPVAQMLRHEGEKLPHIALIGLAGLGRHAPLGREMHPPARQLRRHVGIRAQQLALGLGGLQVLSSASPGLPLGHIRAAVEAPLVGARIRTGRPQGPPLRESRPA